MKYRLWVSDSRTVLVRLWEDGTLEVATRDQSGHTWGLPINMTEEVTSDAT